MTGEDFGLTFLPAEVIDSTPRERVEVILKLTAHNSVLVGRLLDLIEHAAALGNIDCEVEAPGYRQAFYGWEKSA